MDAESTAPKQRGRPFPKGKSGNPRGRPHGARNRATLAAEKLLAGEAEELTRKCIELAKEGDGTALRLCMERILSPTKGRPVKLSLPPIDTVTDILSAQAIAIDAMARGQITPAEAAEIAGVLETRRRTIETVELEQRIAKLEAQRK